MQPKDRKLAAVGLTRMLTQSAVMTQEPAVQAWCVIAWLLMRIPNI